MRGPQHQAARRPEPGPVRRILPAVILFYATLLPDEVRFYIGQQTIYAPRMAYFGLALWIVSNLINFKIKFRLADWLIFIGAVLAPVTFILYYGIDKGFTRGVVLGLDVIMPYLVGRLAIRDLDDLRRFLVLAAPGALLAGLSIVAESIASHEIVRPVFANIFSPLPRWENGVAVGTRMEFTDYRYGFLRVAGPFSHPIIAAVFMGSLFITYAGSGLRNWPLWVGLLTIVFNLLTFSSSGVFMIVMAAFITAYELLQRHVSFLKWQHALTGAAVLLTTIQLVSGRGIVALIGALSFNPESTEYRRLIWQFGGQWALQHPIIGTAFDTWARPVWMTNPTVDNYWLAIAMRHGLIETGALFFGLISVVLLAVRALPYTRNSIDRRLQFALLTTISALCIVEFTFFVFGGLLYWHYMLLGISYSISVNLMQGAGVAAKATFRAPARSSLQPA